MNEDNGFLKGTVILGFSSLVVKFLSAIYRIPLTRMIGAGGMGRYTAAFNFFMPFFSLATAGITPTVSRLCATNTSKDKEYIVSLQRKAALCFGITSFISVGAGLVSGYVYSAYMDIPMIFIGMVLLCPNLIFATFEAIYKGISQGTMNMSVSAKAGVIESSVKTVIGICSVYLAGVLAGSSRGDMQLICAFATVSVSGFVCFAYLYRNFRKTYGKTEKNRTISSRLLFSMAVPISASALVVSLSNFCDSAVCLSIIKNIPDNRLTAAYSFISFSAVEEKAIWLFGVYQGLCLSVVNLIPSLSAAVGASSLPLITKEINQGDGQRIKRQINRIIRLTAAMVVPVSLFVAFFPDKVLITLYGDNDRQTALATEFLGLMAPVAVLSAFSFPLNSIMHSINKSGAILKILLFSCSVKVGLSIALCRVERINIMGCVISQIVFHTLVFILSVNTVKSVYPPKNIFSNIIYPVMLSYILLSFIRCIWGTVFYNIPVEFATIFFGAVFMAVYLSLLLFIGFFVDKK